VTRHSLADIAYKVITCLHSVLFFISRANESDDVMVSPPEIKRIALSIEEELFAYYGEVNTKYKHKFRTMITHLKDPKNLVIDMSVQIFYRVL